MNPNHMNTNHMNTCPLVLKTERQWRTGVVYLYQLFSSYMIYSFLNRFKITAVNEDGAGINSTEVFVQKKSALPGTPDMFTVITYKNPENLLTPIYRLMWKAPKNLGDSGHTVVGYTLFWCQQALYDIRCEVSCM